jgi:hypothetical protein
MDAQINHKMDEASRVSLVNQGVLFKFPRLLVHISIRNKA